MSGLSRLMHSLRLSASAGAVAQFTTRFELGELTDYDPATHTAKFTLPMAVDENDTEVETGYIPIGTFATGPAYGSQFPPDVGQQALIIFADSKGFTPIGAFFLFNEVETPPFPDGKTSGWKDKTGSVVSSNEDSTPGNGDGLGSTQIIGKSTAMSQTAGGHSHEQSDVKGETLQQTPKGHKHRLSDTLNRIEHETVDGLKHTLDDVRASVDTFSRKVGLGKAYDDLAAANSVMHNAHITQFESDLTIKRLADHIFGAMGMVATGVTNATAYLAYLQGLSQFALGHVTVPAGSAVTRTDD